MIWGEGEPGVVYHSWCSLARFISTPWAGFKLASGSHLQAWGSLGCSWSPGSFPCSLPSLLLWFSLLYSRAPCAAAAGNLLCKALTERLRCCSCPYKSPGTWNSIPNPSTSPCRGCVLPSPVVRGRAGLFAGPWRSSLIPAWRNGSIHGLFSSWLCPSPPSLVLLLWSPVSPAGRLVPALDGDQS